MKPASRSGVNGTLETLLTTSKVGERRRGMVSVQAATGLFSHEEVNFMAYIYCICHDGVGYIGKDKREVSQYTRLIDHLNNSFIPSSKDNSVITIHR